MKPLAASILPLTLLAATLPAQRDLAAGFSAESLYINLDAATGEVGSLGLQHLGGEIFVTTRGNPNPRGFHFVTVFDGTGSKLRSWFQPGLAQASEWGFRDGATDGNNLFFGFEFGIEIVDVNGVLLDGLSGPNLQSSNGPVTVFGGLINGNVLEPEQAGVVRALAYDRNGNGGDGSFWTGNFESSVFEIDTAGDVLRSYPNAGEVSYGFGIDPTSNVTRMWINSVPSPEASWDPLGEYDLTTGTLTGKVMREMQGIQGGLDIVPGTLGRGGLAGGYDILHLQQGGPDEVRSRRLHLDVAGEGIPPAPATRLGTREPDLLNTIDDAQLWPVNDRGRLAYSAQTSTLEMIWDLSRDPGDGAGSGGLNGTPAVIFINIGPDAAVGIDATSNVLNIRELAHLQPLLTAPQPQFAVRSRGMVLSNDPLLPRPEWIVDLTPGVPFQDIGECVRAQGMWIDADVAFLPIALTNQVRFCRAPDSGPIADTYAVMLGNNTFNADTTAGFFQIINEPTNPDLSIVRLTYSINFGGTGNSAATQNLIDNFFRWDTDNGGMADLFEGGDSQMMDCLGTYRNGSEVTTGLIFASTTQQNATPCDPLSLQGWVGSIDGPTAYGAFDGDWLQLDFSFAPDTFLNGAKFEFDADTDEGVGVNGGAMAGVIVSVEFKNGFISTAEILPDANIPFRAFARL